MNYNISVFGSKKVFCNPNLSTYLFHPNIGAMVQPTDIAQIISILSNAVFLVRGCALNPLTITLYLSKAINVMVQIDAQPHNEPNIP